MKAALPGAANRDGSSVAYTVLDGDTSLFDPGAAAGIVARAVTGSLPEVARDRNSICFRAELRYAGAAATAIVKAARPGPQRSNPDDTFGWEARVLGALPSLGIRSAPLMIARIRAGDRCFLLTSELPGRHPHARAHPFTTGQLPALLEELHALDACGLMHYDLKAANVLVHDLRASFIDYEFARFQETWPAMRRAAGFCADFNVSSNPYAPGRSNVANFEFRTLHHYLADLEATGDATAHEVVHAWLAARSAIHYRVAAQWERLEADSEVFTRGRAVRPAVSLASQRAAVAHERELGRLLARPAACAVRAERAVMAFRCAVFERRDDEARRWQAIAASALQEGGRTGVLPPGYCSSTMRVLALVARSTHPGPRSDSKHDTRSRCDPPVP